jgi:hypothetical protein
MTGDHVLVKQLGALPVIHEYLQRLGVRERVDMLAPVREVAHLTNGQVVEALVANRLTAPRPLYDIAHWAEQWAVEEVLGIPPAALNDDRLGRCLDDLAGVHDYVRGDLTIRAVRAFGLETRTLRWDLTSVVVTGAYPEAEQDADYAQVRYGYGGNGQPPRQQVRYLQVSTSDGAVPVWDQVYDGNTPDVATVIATMRALQAYADGRDFVLGGDSKLLSAANRQALLTAGLGYLAPLTRTPELDAEFLAIAPEEWEPLDYASAREQRRPSAERTTYQGAERQATVALPDGEEGMRPVVVRRLFVVSSEERAACQRNRARQRERAEAEIARVVRQVGGRWYPTAERAQAKIDAILERRHLREFYQVTAAPGGPERDGRPTVTCEVIATALARAEALDGHYVLETTRPVEAADGTALLTEWKGQWELEHRHRDAKGPRCIRPLFVTSNRRIVGLITILSIALLIFSLLERAARQAVDAMGAGQKVANLLAGHVAARPTGENLLKALSEISLVTFGHATGAQQVGSSLSPLQRTLLRMLSVPEAVYARLVT